MGIEVLVPLVIGALLKVLDRAADGALNSVEDAGKKAAGSVFDKIRSWWSNDPKASDDLARFESEPEVYQPVVEARLIGKLKAEPEMQTELSDLLNADALKPHVEVFQKVAEAHGITGAKVEEMLAGSVRVRQEIERASNVTGAEIKQLG